LLSQKNDNSNSILSACQKDYLYGLSKFNIGVLLQYKASNLNDTTKLLLIKEKLGIDLKIESYENIAFSIQEKCDSAAIQANAFFIFIASCNAIFSKTFIELSCSVIHCH
jgi:hypothetical protein